MSGTVTAPLAADLKAAVVAAADAHLAGVSADVARVKNAVAGDLANVATVAKSDLHSVEDWFITELEAIEARFAKWKKSLAVAGGASGVGGLLWAAVHFGFLVF